MGIKRPVAICVAYAMGQLTQFIIHRVCLNNNVPWSEQIGFSAAAGFLILFALVCGVWIAQSKADGNHEEKKTYKDYAEVPIDGEGVKLFDKK